MNGLRALEEKGVETLTETIKEPAYLRHFISMAKKIAPDGESLKTVGFTTINDGVETKLPLHKPQKEYAEYLSIVNEAFPDQDDDQIGKKAVVKGTLTRASSDNSQITVKYKDPSISKKGEHKIKGKNLKLSVPDGLGDIVRSHFEGEVEVQYVVDGKDSGELIDIDSAD